MDFIQSIEGIQLRSEECMMSFDVESLFTSVPIQSPLAIIKKLLEEDKNLQQRTTLMVNQISCPSRILSYNNIFYIPGKDV